jgi:hypothetical protein
VKTEQDKPSAEAMEAVSLYLRRGAPHGLAHMLDAFAAHRVEQAVSQERERCLWWTRAIQYKRRSYTLPEVERAIEEGRPKP